MKSTERFSDRVEDYVKYRPHYEAGRGGRFLAEVYGFAPSWEVADVGSGTGISTEPFLKHGNTLFAIEPNDDMRRKAEELLGGYERFVSVDGTAEATGLAEASVELVVAGQAFHWFDPVRSREEFVRVLKPGGVVALIWNERLMESPFESAYEALILHYASDYKTINHKKSPICRSRISLLRRLSRWINLPMSSYSVSMGCRVVCFKFLYTERGRRLFGDDGPPGAVV